MYISLHNCTNYTHYVNRYVNALSTSSPFARPIALLGPRFFPLPAPGRSRCSPRRGLQQFRLSARALNVALCFFYYPVGISAGTGKPGRQEGGPLRSCARAGARAFRTHASIYIIFRQIRIVARDRGVVIARSAPKIGRSRAVT